MKQKTGRKLLSLLLTLAMVFSTMSGLIPGMRLTAYAVTASGDFGENNSLHWELNDEGTLTISGNGDMPDYDYYDDVPWYSYTYTDIQTVIIEDGVTGIGEYAFNNCQNLTSVNISNNVMRIGRQAFYLCNALTDITIPENVTIIESETFCKCTNLECVSIPNGVTGISEKAFEDCTSLKEIIIPNTVISIGTEAFYNCTALTSVKLPENLSTISEYVFYGCESLEKVSIPSSVNTIENYAFYCRDDMEVTFIRPNAEQSLEIKYGFPDNAKIAYDGTGNYVLFDGDTPIESGSNAEGINGKTLTWKKVNSAATNEWDSGDCHLSFDSATGTMTVSVRTDAEAPGGGMMDNYIGTDPLPWDSVKGSITSVVIQDGVTGIGDNAFYLCSNMNSITIPASVTSIGEDAFYDDSTTGLTATFTRPAAEGTLAVGYNAFYNANCYFNYGGEGKYVLFDGDTEIKDGDSLGKLNGSNTYDSPSDSFVNMPKTLTWIIPTFSITDKSENGSVTAKVDGTAVEAAQKGDTVVLTVTPDNGYRFKEITVAVPKASIEALSDLVPLMGTAVFTGNDSITCKVSGGQFVLLDGDTIKAELSSEAELSQVNTSSYMAKNGNYSWQFNIDENNRITSIYVSISHANERDEMIFSSDSGQQSNGKLPETPYECTMVTEGEEYYFTMPASDVTVSVIFEEIHEDIPKFDIYVKTVTGTTYTLNVMETETILGVKEKLVEKTGMAVEAQRLIFAGKVLDNDKTLADYNIQKD